MKMIVHKGISMLFRSMRPALLLLFVFSSFYSFAQPDPPIIRCISVESNGTVTLNWTAPTDTGSSFGGYHIYFSSSAGGPFLPIDSIFTYSTLSTTVPGVNANSASLYFYIQTRDGCCNNYSVSSDTLKSIRMIVTPLSNESVRLNWNRTHNPPLPSTLSAFVLSKELTPGVYTNFMTLLDTTALDTNIFCNRFINYKVTQGDVTGCTSVSSIDGELFRDTRGPSQPMLDTVSIDPLTGDVNITWYPDSSADTEGYVIYQFNGLSYDSIGAVYGINSLSFTYTGMSSSQIETYTVAAFDSCKNLGALAVNHNTILLQGSFVKCTAEISLEWNAYNNLYNGLSRYEIWYRENTGPWLMDGFVPPNVYNYEKTLTVQGAVYDFLIRAVGNDGHTASSNVVSQVADIYNLPAFLYIRSLNVAGSAVEVNCHVDPAGDIVSYRFYRSNSITGPYSWIGDVNFTASSSVVFLDQFAGADQAQKFYKITAVDSCGLEQVTGNIAATVFLNAQGGNDFISHLNWIDYMGWMGPTGHFDIYRVVNGTVSPAPIATVAGDTVSFEDDVSDFPVDGGNICYLVKAVEDSVNIYGFTDEAVSNIACAPQSPAVYLPNAFTPGGKNPVFKPFLLFADPAHYSMKIFNRWGQLVFNSSVPGEGWTGEYQDADSPAGTYVYLLVFKGYNRKEIRKSGTVVLIR